ncbi:Uncharacterised protein [Acinetobacter haemolyticus]|uniref:Uncharacterized protein n=2 Tax=Acinetobacter haemolyticus TaxID=29430 RepID=N9GM76_ACIHA|nr:hypothetical protein F927_01770 [Acinetobacter haemolyticus CIP 64.3 = MTCC 9819]QXZ28313.1 hypothetical protein I6L22_09290 [Acinetobacter haemolyticus]SPT47890.1 Uncharacterised protein [Acinetobacter haemolyticus]SUU56924.1 Uncharacterised protein [Acinetobacter haemolyticus]
MDKVSAHTWFYLLETRFMIHHEILEGRGLDFWTGKDVLNNDEEQEAITLLLDHFFKNPLNPYLSINYKKQNGEIICIQIGSNENNSFMRSHLPVSEFYASDFDLLHSMVNRGGGDFTDKDDLPILEVVEPLYSEDYIFVDYPITINPCYPDHVLIDEFKKMLIKIRSKRSKDTSKYKSISYKDLVNWASYKLLPYLDLKLLEIYKGIKITNPVICSILYPKGEYGEDNLRKSVEPLRQKLLTQIGFDGADGITEVSILDGLCYLAFHEKNQMEK